MKAQLIAKLHVTNLYQVTGTIGSPEFGMIEVNERIYCSHPVDAISRVTQITLRNLHEFPHMESIPS